MIPELFAAGGATIDCIVAADGALSLGEIGGNAVHAAVGATLAGARAGIVARVPRGWPVERLAGTGIDAGGILVEPVGAAEPEWFFLRDDGSRADRLHASLAEAAAFGIQGARIDPALAAAWQAHLRNRPDAPGYAGFRAAHPVAPRDVPPAWWQARGLHVSPGDGGAMLALAQEGRARGLVVTLDPGFAARGVSPALLDAWLAACDLFLPSEAELAALRPGVAPPAALQSLARPGGPVLLAKLGAAGAMLLGPEPGPPRLLPALPAAARDPVGAGDAFAGGVLAGLVAGAPPHQAARLGILAGAFAVEASGALAPLAAPRARIAARRAEIEAMSWAECA